MDLGEERVGADEAADIQRIIDLSMKTLARRDGVMRRGQHAKHHGLVKAQLTVSPDLDEAHQVGIFQPGRIFAAVVRFSNGARWDDNDADAHGMAIKLLDVPDGPKLLPGAADDNGFDIVLVDHPTFFVKDMADYVAVNRHFGSIIAWKQRKTLGRFLPMVMAYGYLGLVNRTLAKRAKAFANQKPPSPLATPYWSTTPFAFGEETGQPAVKYMVRPVREPLSVQQKGENRLAQALKAHLAVGPAVFEFGVHIQADAAAHPVEDASVNWETATPTAKFILLGRIEIPAQSVDATSVDAERAVFNPWRATAAHRPLGIVNRVRRDVYVAMANAREQANS